MTKSFDPGAETRDEDLTRKLMRLMNQTGISLIRASQILKIPYAKAKQILFTHGTNRTIGRLMSNSAKLSPRTKQRHCARFKKPEKEMVSRLDRLAHTEKRVH